MPYISNIWQIWLLRNLLNCVLHFYFTILFEKWDNEKRWYLSEVKKTEEKQNSPTIMESVDIKGAVFPMKFKLQVKSLESY